MNIKKYEILKEVQQTNRYRFELRWSKERRKLGIDVYNNKNNKILKPVQRSYTKTTFFNLYGMKQQSMFSKYELICFISGIDVLGVTTNYDYVMENIDKIKEYARRYFYEKEN